MPGPVPKRSDKRRHRIKPDVPIRKSQAQPFVECPPPGKGWDKRARHWYESLALSGQSVYYEPTDWATALTAGALLSDIYTNGFSNASQIKMWIDMNDGLLATEGARRRARVELVRDGSEISKPKDRAASRDRDRSLLEVV